MTLYRVGGERGIGTGGLGTRGRGEGDGVGMVGGGNIQRRHCGITGNSHWVARKGQIENLRISLVWWFLHQGLNRGVVDWGGKFG